MASRIKEQVDQVGKFFGVGILSTSAHYACMILVVEVVKSPPVAASSIGYGVGAVVSYLLNYTFTFKSNRPHVDAGIRFMLGALLGLLVNTAIMYIGTNVLNANYLLAQFVATGVVFFINFVVGKFWTFKRI